MMKIRIKSDGTTCGTEVTNLETGEMIPCTEITWTAKVDEIPTVTITMHTIIGELDLVGECNEKKESTWTRLWRRLFGR